MTGERQGARFVISRLLAAPLIVLTPFLGYVRFHDYELWRPEILATMAMLVALGLILTAFMQLRRELLEPAVFSLLLFLFADFALLVSGRNFLVLWLAENESAPVRLAIIAYLFLPVLGFAFVTWLLRTHLTLIISVVFGVMALGNLLLPVQTLSYGETYKTPLAAADQSLDPVVHIILDEQVGIGGLPIEIPETRQLADDLRRFYADYDFHLYENAYSLFSVTTDSVTNLLNGALDSSRAFLSGEKPRFTLEQNDWLAELAERGYRLRIYQSAFIDYCTGQEEIARQVESCLTYPTDSIAALKDEPLPLGQKVAAITRHLLRYSQVMWMAISTYERKRGMNPAKVGDRGNWWLRIPTQITAPQSRRAMERLLTHLAEDDRGRVYFAHLLIPHRGYLLNPDCTAKNDVAEWDSGFNLRRPPYYNDAQARATSYIAYADQVRCVQKLLTEVFEVLKAKGLWDKALVIVHGDHGSRISHIYTRSIYRDIVTDQDMRDNHSTLFAVKFPSGRARIDLSQRSIQALFTEQVRGRDYSKEDRDVYLDKSGGVSELEPRRIPMPNLGR